MSNKIDQHEIYKKLITDYPWLWEAPSPVLSDEDYRRAFKLQTADWFPYLNYYKLEILDELKPYLFSFGGMAPTNNAVFLRSVWQFNAQTHGSSIFVKHPHAEALVAYFDILTTKNSEVIDFYKKYKKFEYNEEGPRGFGLR